MKPLNATVITQLKQRPCRRPQKSRSQLYTHARVEKHLHFHYRLRYHCHYLFFTMLKRRAGITPPSPSPPPPLISQPIPQAAPPISAPLYAPISLRTSPKHFWKKGANEGQRNIIYTVGCWERHSIMTIMIIYEMAINSAVTLTWWRWWVACGGERRNQYQCQINCCSLKTAMVIKCQKRLIHKSFVRFR